MWNDFLGQKNKYICISNISKKNPFLYKFACLHYINLMRQVLNRISFPSFRYHSSNISVNIVSSISKVEPFKCLISPPVQHKWYSNIVEASNKTLGDLKLTKESSELLIESSENLVNGYHANLVWLLHEMTQGCRWYKKSIFEEEMHIKWVDTVE